ncbi:MAG: PD-(D/E)XK nuclease family protein [Bilophila sp.]
MTPFRIVPWDVDFLDALKTGILEATEGQPGNAVVVFMHDRPRRYLTERFRRDPELARPCLLPRIFTVRELVAAFRQEQDAMPLQEAGRLDQVALLSACVRKLAEPETELCQQLAHTDEARFFPWGVLLANLMEECFTQGLTPDDLAYTEGEVAPFGAALLGSLGKIFKSYRVALRQNGLTTPGFDAFSVAEYLKQAQNDPSRAGLPDFLAGRALLVAGYGTPTDTEDAIFRHLWNCGAQFWLHVDPALADQEGARAHWACEDQARWITTWGARAELVCPPAGRKPKIHYFAGYDLHSQLEALRCDLLALTPSEDVAETPSGQQDIAVALAHSGALLPVLHHLPRKDCNISLGYPLERSLLFRLLETILKVRHQRRADGTTHWRALADLVRHPYLRLLEADGLPLRDTLQLMERHLRTGDRYVDPHLLARKVLQETLAAQPVSAFRKTMPNAENAEDAEETLATLGTLLNRILHDTVDAWAGVKTLAGLADALAGLCETLLLYGSGGEREGTDKTEKSANIWARFPIDAECLYRLMQRVIPGLKNNGMADTALPWGLLQVMLLELVRAERVPFEADPLTGLQVLGMLETRLLRFSRVFLMDVTDDRLPGAPIRSPLLPDSLRTLLGLPDTRHREQLAAYTFHRLLAGADEIWLYWQEGVETSGLFDGKKQRSRLVEELIWREEQRRGSRLKPGQEPLRTAALDMRPPVRTRRSVPKTPIMQAQIEASLKKPLSATRLDAYLTCPLRYYFERLCGIAPADEVLENDDPAAVGKLLHEVLRDFYTPFINQTAPSPADETTLRTLFTDALTQSGLATALPPESATMLTVSGPERLTTYLRNQPADTRILSLEEEYTTDIEVCGRTRHLTGLLDRVDWRASANDNAAGAVILDYKTGRLKRLRSDLWDDVAFWEALGSKDLIERLKDSDPATDLLPEVSQRVPTVQLLYYCYLYEQATGNAVRDAAFVGLGEDGKEYPLFGESTDDETRERVLSHFVPNLIGFILLHMELCPVFRPREGAHCRWCSWQNLCIMPQQP